MSDIEKILYHLKKGAVITVIEGGVQVDDEGITFETRSICEICYPDSDAVACDVDIPQVNMMFKNQDMYDIKLQVGVIQSPGCARTPALWLEGNTKVIPYISK